MRQTVNGAPTTYTLDLNAGLTQVLSDGTNMYLYGNGRIAQQSAASTDYFLGDTLGSVRQLTDATGVVTLAKSYEPYGSGLSSAGSGASIYGYTGEVADTSGLEYLRARYYSFYLNQWIQPDPIIGQFTDPRTLNRYVYVNDNPINHTDPSGLYVCSGYDVSWRSADCYRVVDGLLMFLNNSAGVLGQNLVAGFWASDAATPIDIKFDTIFPNPKADTRFGKLIQMPLGPGWDWASNNDWQRRINAAYFGHELFHLTQQRNAYVIASAYGEKQAYDAMWVLMENMGMNPEANASDPLQQIHRLGYSDQDLAVMQQLVQAPYLRPAKEGEAPLPYWWTRINAGLYTASYYLGIAGQTCSYAPYVVTGCIGNKCWAPGSRGP